MHNKPLLKHLLLISFAIILFSCDKEYSGVGNELIGESNFKLLPYSSEIVSYNKEIDNVLTSELPVNLLGFYDHPVFGATTANFVTEVSLETVNPKFGNAPKIQSVTLDVPYYSTRLSSDNTKYKLDSIYGKLDGKFKLSIYESGLSMRKVGETNSFYSNQNELFDTKKNLAVTSERLNNSADKSQNDDFFFHKEANTINNVISPPGMRLSLDTIFFKEKIFNAPANDLTTNDRFMNHFKGLYFKVEQIANDAGSLALIDFSKGKITIKYKDQAIPGTGESVVEKTLVLNLSGKKANLFINNYNQEYLNAIRNPSSEKLYLKGGQGSMAVLELFKSNISENGIIINELEKIRKEGWLINEANLVFNVDSGPKGMGLLDNPLTNFPYIQEPFNIFVFDYTNARMILDYSTNSLFGGNLVKNTTTGRGMSYKIRITDYIRALVKNPNLENVKLGLSVTQNMNNNTFTKETKIPTANVLSPLGTVIYGGNTQDENKKLKLEIYYTKP